MPQPRLHPDRPKRRDALADRAVARRVANRVGLGCGGATLALAMPVALAHAAGPDPLSVSGAAGLALAGAVAIGAACMVALASALGVLMLAREVRRHRHG